MLGELLGDSELSLGDMDGELLGDSPSLGEAEGELLAEMEDETLGDRLGLLDALTLTDGLALATSHDRKIMPFAPPPPLRA